MQTEKELSERKPKYGEKMRRRLEGLDLDEAHYLIVLDNYLYAKMFEKEWNKIFVAFMKFVSRLGDGYGWIFLAASFFISVQFFSKVSYAGSTYFFIRGLCGALFCIVAFTFIKNTVHRTRPFHMHKNKSPLLKAPDKYSFPSGHTMVAFSMIFTAGFAAPYALIYSIVLAFSIAVSRVVVGLHYPSDVIGGAVLGSIVGILTNLLFSLVTAPRPMMML